jgi:hypothetical protein
MYEVVAKNASASYRVGAGTVGGAACAAAGGAGFDSDPQPATKRSAVVIAPKGSKAEQIFMGSPRGRSHSSLCRISYAILVVGGSLRDHSADGHGNDTA